MMTVEPYGGHELPALRRHVRAYGLELHTPPAATASFHYPGRTVFAAITPAGREVRWLAEQVAYGGVGIRGAWGEARTRLDIGKFA